CLQIKNSPRTF
nr:immunoglobulin light chain junction region [Macaca mulatta]MOY10950.1 immunoglobulin light chain junction region [Macaca mulatta]